MPATLARAWKEFKAAERAEYERGARRKIAATIPRVTRGLGSATTSADAYAEFRSTGNMEALVNARALQKAERKFGIK